MNKNTSEAYRKFSKRLVMTARGKMGAMDMKREQAEEALDYLFTSEANDVQISAFLTAMRFKGATSDELTGFYDSIKKNSLSIHPEVDGLLDLSSPYDGRIKSLSLQIAFALVTAAAGVPVIIHSTTGLVPKSGVTHANILESLAIPAFLEPGDVEKRVEKDNFGFLHAKHFAFGIEKLRNIREKLGYRTLLNTCESVNNPANAQTMMFGVAHFPFIEKLLKVVTEHDVTRALGVIGLEGSDELPMQISSAIELKDGKLFPFDLNPEDYGLKLQNKTAGKSASETAKIIYKTLDNSLDDYKDAVIYNSGIRIYLGGKADTIADGIELAKETLESGKALQKYRDVASFSA
ncbi:MAG: anthranilate phosphoribosyltransferase [Nitrospinae bacterium]|nr:anthranilate phosphoribosyltransferase [Nitrospinota bacterium]